MTDPDRGIRNNNPGNIDRTNIPWQGMAVDQSGDPRFIIFKSAEWGIRAICRILLNYYTNDGCKTIRQIIQRWAPPEENNTDAYVDAVARDCGCGPDDPVDARDAQVMAGLVKAIIQHENGQQPYADLVIQQGLALAGVGPIGGPRIAAVGGANATKGA